MPDLTTKDAQLEKIVAMTASIGALAPVGVVQAFAGSTVPDGWLPCDGSAISRTDYADLFAVIGTTYGSGDGSTTFNVPNLIDKFVEGSATAGTVKAAGLPNIEGSVVADIGTSYVHFSAYAEAFVQGSELAYNNANYTGATVSTKGNALWFDASKSDAIYGNSATVQPPAITMSYIIKY